MVPSCAAFLFEKLVEIRSPLLTAGPVLVATYIHTHSEKSSYTVAMETTSDSRSSSCSYIHTQWEELLHGRHGNYFN